MRLLPVLDYKSGIFMNSTADSQNVLWILGNCLICFFICLFDGSCSSAWLETLRCILWLWALDWEWVGWRSQLSLPEILLVYGSVENIILSGFGVSWSWVWFFEACECLENVSHSKMQSFVHCWPLSLELWIWTSHSVLFPYFGGFLVMSEIFQSLWVAGKCIP